MKLIHNAIIAGRYYTAGVDIPDGIIPRGLRKYEAPDEDDQEQDKPDEVDLMRKYNQPYSVDPETGRMGRAVGRQIAELQAANFEQEDAEDQASAEPDSVTAEALAQAREDWSADVSQQIANARISAENDEAAKDAVRAEHDKNLAEGEFDEFDEPPKRTTSKRKTFVKRHGKFVLASSVYPDSGRETLLASSPKSRSDGQIYSIWKSERRRNIMSKFKLKQVFANRSLVKFHVLSGNDIVGSVNVEPGAEVDELLRNWHVEVERPKQQQQSAKQNPFVAAMMKPRGPMTKEAVLRGCL
jgi:hypothetical protein